MRRIIGYVTVISLLSFPVTAATISKGSDEPITRETSKSLYRQWGQKGLDRINAALKGAVARTAQSPKCDNVFLSGYSFERSDPPRTFIVFATCTNGQQFFFAESEALSIQSTTSATEKLEKITESQAIVMCREIARNDVMFKSAMEISAFGSNVQRNENGNISVAMPFTARNALGAILPYVAHCAIDDRGARLISIKPN